jgi:phage shock protein A
MSNMIDTLHAKEAEFEELKFEISNIEQIISKRKRQLAKIISRHSQLTTQLRQNPFYSVEN